MPGHYPRKTLSVAHLRTSFEQSDTSSVRSRASRVSIKPAEEQTPLPHRESQIQRRGRAMKETTSTPGSLSITERRSMGKISKEMTPPPLHLRSTETGNSRSFEPQLTAQGYDITPSPMTDHTSTPTQKTLAPRSGRQRPHIPGRDQSQKVASKAEVATLTWPSGRRSVLDSSVVHPLLSQKQSLGREGHKTSTPRDATDVGEPSGNPTPQTVFARILDHPRKVADLRERYDRTSSSTSSFPFHRQQDEPSRPQLPPTTTSLVALSTAIGLATFQGGSKTPSPTDTPTNPRNNPGEITSGGVLPTSPQEQPQQPHDKLPKKQHESPLKDKIGIFESLGRPASGFSTLAKAQSSKAAATVRRRSGDVGNGLKKMADSGSQIWRRLSGSFEKETQKTPPMSSREVGPGDGPSSSHTFSGHFAQKSRLSSRGTGLEPRRNTHPSSRESTFFVQGTISRVPQDVVGIHQLRPSASVPSPSPVLPDLDFTVDGAADMMGYFEQNFNISFSFTSSGSRAITSNTTSHSAEPSHDSNKTSAPKPLRSHHLPPARTSRASPVPSIHSVQAHATRPAIPPRNPARRRNQTTTSSSTSQQRVRSPRHRPPTPAPRRGRSRETRPVRPVPSTTTPVSERDEEEVVFREAQCGLAHPRPSRVLNLKRFVGYCRGTTGRVVSGRGKL